MASTGTNTTAEDSNIGFHLQLNDVLNTLDISGFSISNSHLMSAMLTLNLLWSAIFLVSFYLILDMVMYYIPLLNKIPLLPTIKNLCWFISTLLVAVSIYASGTLLIIKIFGGVVLLLAFLGMVKTFYMFIAMALSYYRHRNIAVALNGPNVVMVNGTAVHSDFIPTSVTLVKKDGELYFQGTKVPGNNLVDATVKIFTFNESFECLPIALSRYTKGSYARFELKSTNTHYELQTFYPSQTETKSV